MGPPVDYRAVKDWTFEMVYRSDMDTVLGIKGTNLRLDLPKAESWATLRTNVCVDWGVRDAMLELEVHGPGTIELDRAILTPRLQA